MGKAHQRFSNEGQLLHHPAGRHGHRRTAISLALFWHHHRPALDGTRRRQLLGMSIRCPSAHPLCESRRGLIGPDERSASSGNPDVSSGSGSLATHGEFGPLGQRRPCLAISGYRGNFIGNKRSSFSCCCRATHTCRCLGRLGHISSSRQELRVQSKSRAARAWPCLPAQRRPAASTDHRR